ncbi:MAG: histidine kinase [Ferruginibacter sp.]
MSLHEFIFSEKHRHRVVRHISFWLVYSFYFYIQSIPPKTFEEFFTARPYFIAFVNTCCYAPVYLTVTYLFVYRIAPATIKQEKYLQFVGYFLLAYVAGMFINYFTTGIFIHYTHYTTDNFKNRFGLSSCNTRWAMIIAVIATGIKLFKDWHVQEQENLQMLKKKTRSEMQLQKSRIHPDLLLRSLDNVYDSVNNNFHHSADMILKLSDMLSYSLYESDKEIVPVKKELEELANLVEMEQLSPGNCNIKLSVSGDFKNKYMPPMLFVKLFEEFINQLCRKEKNSCHLVIQIIEKENTITGSLVFEDSNRNKQPDIKWTPLLAIARNRLSEYYDPGAYRVQLITKEHTRILMLELNTIQKKENSSSKFAIAYDNA